jgi:DNA-directed RNA polymerase specialized sigma24 family protein
MSSVGSVTQWIEDLKGGDDDAAAKIWNHFYCRLVRMASSKLSGLPKRAMADEEDVALSAMKSFCHGAQEGRFPRLNDRDDLWRLLLTITERKAKNLIRNENRLKRGGGKVLGESAFFRGEPSNTAGIGEVVSPEPTPELVAIFTEAMQQLLNLLDGELRDIAVWKLEGYTNAEIAKMIDRAVPTVERRLSIIRGKWKENSAS